MEDFSRMDDDMDGTQIPAPEENFETDHAMADNGGGLTPVPASLNSQGLDQDDDVQHGDENMSMHGAQTDDQEDLPGRGYSQYSGEAHADTSQYSGNHEEHVYDTIEQQENPELHGYRTHEPSQNPERTMHNAYDNPMDNAESDSLEVQPDDGSAAHVDHGNIEDPSSLFVSEHATPVPRTTNQPGPSTHWPHITHPSVPSQSATPPTSMYAKIRNMQTKLREKKDAARQRASHPSHSNIDNEAYNRAIMAGIQSSATLPVVDEDEAADRQARADFQKQKLHYDELRRRGGGNLTFRQDIEWIKIRGAEDARLKKRARDLAKAQEEEYGELDLFPEISNTTNDNPDEDSDNPFHLDNVGSRKRRRENPRKQTKNMSMQDAELLSMQVALEAQVDVPIKRKKGQPGNGVGASRPSARGRVPKSSHSRASKAKATTRKMPKSGGGRRSAKDKRELDNAVKQATSLFNSNVFQQQAGANAAEQPAFRSRVKADALKELIASVPLEDKQKAKSDMNILLAATKDFDGKGSVKPDGGLWRVKGMRTSLKGYQILGTAFMRRRENDAAEPRGGLMADQMGLGKTLMMLANIVNGQPPKGANGPRTTLLVASPALLTQWKNEIEQHTDKEFLIMRYGAGSRLDSNRASEILGGHDIILTSYNEIMKSYPKNEPPIECQTAEQKIAWWKEVYENQRGVLHRMVFLRIVLDEAQAIKNHVGRTSIACRALMARHKWALSGTPILNSLTELYPYFKFLGVPHTGSFKIFKHNYCGNGDAENTERLLVRLSQFMIRRTHADEMFGAPILKLPQADQSTYWCEFNSVERCIYDIVRSRFAKSINMWAKKGDLEKSYSNALVMLLRLRQLTAHVLMLQFVMQDLLEREDIERIRQVVDGQMEDCTTGKGRTIIAVRKQLEKLAEDERRTRAAKEAAKTAAKEAGEDIGDATNILFDEDIDQIRPQETSDEDEERTQPTGGRTSTGGRFGKDYNFKPFLKSLKTGESWDRAKKKVRCYECEKRPKNPWVTSCGHFVCGSCLEQATLEAAENDARDQSICKVCKITPTYVHPCDSDDEGSPETVAQSTRSRSRKKKESEDKRLSRDDIREDWLAGVGDDVLPSAKTIAVKAQILNWTKENPHVKIIIYTQFLAMVRILARVCQKEGWQAEQYHGNMSLSARDKAISNFAENPNTKIMLASLRAGGLGLNLTMASKVIMIDPWWNSASEQQAFCRVFRIGQKEETFMSRLCVKNTVDARLIEMQERKQEEIDAVMADDGSKVKKMSIRDLMRLFGNLEEDPDGKPFIMVDNPDPRGGGLRADRDDEGYADEA